MIDQEWAKDNFDIIMKYFTLLNTSETSQNKSYHKKQMAVNMDKPIYRAYYYLAKNDEKKKMEKSKSIADRKRYQEDQLIRSMNDENMKRCIDILENQLLLKDKQIVFLEKMMESRALSIEAEL